jgi:hypothetical protein
MYIYGLGNAGYGFSESDIRYAMQNTRSNMQAARFLRVTPRTYKKYAKMYIDSSTGKTLWELHKNIPGKGICKHIRRIDRMPRSLDAVLDGSQPGPKDLGTFKKRLLLYDILEQKCSVCEFEERRVTDYSMPLVLDWIDGDRTNCKRSNLRFLCYNCHYLMVHGPYGGRTKQHII